jgi:hypothetical protein
MNKLVAKYEQDFDAWIQQHINLLKQGFLSGNFIMNENK